jgi:hypothetical protein
MSILHKLEDYRPLVVVAVVSFIAGFIAAYFMQRRVSTGDPTEIPVVGKTVASISHHLHESHKHPDHKPTDVEPNAELMPPLLGTNGTLHDANVAKETDGAP